jgi:hypothetical protein
VQGNHADGFEFAARSPDVHAVNALQELGTALAGLARDHHVAVRLEARSA